MSQLIGSIAELGYSMRDAFELERELALGWKWQQATEKARERVAAEKAQAVRGHKTIPGLGKQILELNQLQYQQLVAKYGYEAFSDRGFLRDMQRLCPENKVYDA